MGENKAPVGQSLFGLGLALTVLLAGTPAVARTASNDDCLACHDDPFPAELPVPQGARTGPYKRLYSGVLHRDLDCIDCHEDLSGLAGPDDLHDEVAPVECGSCHDDEASQEEDSVHGQAARRGDKLAPRCPTCHGTHDILPPSDPRAPTAVMNVPMLCGRCHHEGTPVSLTHDIPKERIFENYSQSIHGEGLYKKGLTVTAVCTSCHTAHAIRPHDDPRSSIYRDNVVATCTQCHTQIEAVHRKIIEGRLWEEEPHKIPVCVDCHSPHQIRKVFYPAGQANKDCLVCHGDPTLEVTRNGETVSLFVDQRAYAESTHAQVACAQCHTEVTANTVERGCATIRSKVDCSICHADQVREYERSIHGTLFAKGDPDAPGCLDCHDKHATQSKSLPTSPTFPRNVPDLCAQCHRQGAKAAVRIHNGDLRIVEAYTDSIHGKGLLRSGLLVAPTCADCHGAHGELPPEDAKSSVNSKNIADTCGKCHYGVEQIFKTSIHWPGNTTTDKELPTCKGCHSAHTISRTDLADFRLRMMSLCGKCHQREAETFFDTFHGKVSRLGAAGVAKCHDCHGTHDILPPSDPNSTLGRRRVVKTCGKCHEGAHRRFAGYLTHATHHDPDKFPWLFWSFWAMTALLVGTLAFFISHTIAWLVRLWLGREEWRRHKAAKKRDPTDRRYVRFTTTQRALHLVMMLSFFTLALTGMTLKFSYTGWAAWVSWALGGFETMGILHRMGAIALMAVVVLHLRDVVRTKRRTGTTWKEMITGPDSIIFNLRDLREFRDSMKWFLGIGPRPHYGRFTYWEKFDYFAVFWGVAVIGSTGLLLWFPELFTRVLPGWSVNVATIIHSDEALLAVGFIFTVHFFNTHFRPDKFPIDTVIFTGRVTVEELRYDKPAEYERLVEQEVLEAHLAAPVPEPVERGFRIFGFAALAVGLSLIGLIVYAMLVSYR